MPGTSTTNTRISRAIKLQNMPADGVAQAVQKALENKGVSVVPERTANVVLVSAGDPDAFQRALKLIDELDAKPAPVQVKPPGGRITVMTLKHAEAEDLAVALKKVFASAEFAANSRSNQLIVRADPETLDEVQLLLKQLDVEAPRRK